MAETEIHSLSIRVRADLSEARAAFAHLGRETTDLLARPMSRAGAQAGAFIEAAVGRVGDALEDAALRGQRSFGDMVRALIQDLQRMALREFVINPLVSAVSGALKGAFGGARAMGGPVSPGRAYLVGEQGPELFTPSGSGRIVPNGQLGLGGAGVTVNFNFPTGTDVDRFRRSESQIAAMMNRVVARGGRNL
ncbi:MAG: phage tail tape measure protein [Alphaproteobacteria bacterium]|nr:phage tail tape measure protein [Alphaproteobacteria bacterium]